MCNTHICFVAALGCCRQSQGIIHIYIFISLLLQPGGGHGPCRGSAELAWGAHCRRAQPNASTWRAASGTPRKQIKAHVTGSNDTPLQYSCLENPTDGGAWWAAVHGITKSRT